MTKVNASMLDIKKFFGITLSSQFAKEWKELSDTDRQWFKENCPVSENK